MRPFLALSRFVRTRPEVSCAATSRAAWSRLLSVALMTVGSPRATVAQSAVTGQVTLAERPGVAIKDVSTAVVFLEPVGAAARERAAEAPPGRAEIRMQGREFIPHVRVVSSGSSVAFPNQDPFSHNVFSNTANANFDSGLYRRNFSKEFVFARQGVYPIYCDIHARMVSFVIVVPTRYFTGVDASGRFAMRDVAPGSYRLHVWHERAPETTLNVDVTAVGASVQVALDTRGYVAAPHTNKFGQPYASTRADRY